MGVPSGGVRSAERALCVLEVLASRARPLPAMILARDCGIPRASVYRLLAVMRDSGFVAHQPGMRAWTLGPKAFELGAGYLRSDTLRRLAAPLLCRLAVGTGGVAHLAVLHGADALIILRQDPDPRSPREEIDVRPGLRVPAEASAVGRALLAESDRAQLALIEEGRLPGRLEHLLGELDTVRETGWAVACDTVWPEVCCVAAAVFSHDVLAVAAVGVSLRRDDPAAENLEQVAADVGAVAAQLTEALHGEIPERMTAGPPSPTRGRPAVDAVCG